MSTYRKIHGRSIQAVTTDPTGDVTEGQVWYNSNSQTFKSVINTQAWSSAAPITTPRFNMGSGANAPVTAGLVFGGSGKSTATEEYNGSGWATGGNLGTGRYELPGFGIQTAAVGAGGYASPSPGNKALVEEYNGSSWSEVTNLPTAQRGMACFGTQTAGVVAGGVSTTANLTTSFEYDGTNWTSGGTLPSGTDRTTSAGAGILTAGLIAAGDTRVSFEYVGTNFTAGPSTASDHDGGVDTGVQTSAVVFGGFTSPGSGRITATETYDGTSFTTSPATMATGRYGLGRGGNNGTSAFAAGGDTNPGTVTSTEEYNSSINVITAGAFSSLPTLNSARWGAGAAGTKAAGIVFGGRNPSISTDLALSEEYNGSSWSEGPDLGQARRVMGRGTGTQTAALAHGGHYGSPSTRYKVAEEYDGSSWTNGGTSTNAHDGTMQIGTQTAAASCGGYDGTNMNKTEEYNGTSFSSANTMTYSAYLGAAAGPQTAAVVFAGGFPAVNNSNEYDGTNWTSGNTTLKTNYGIAGNGGNGSQTEAIGAGGYTPGPVYFSSVETYNGTTFATAPSLGTARSELPSAGPNSSFFVAGGLLSTGSGSNLVEEFTPESSALNVKTLTQS